MKRRIKSVLAIGNALFALGALSGCTSDDIADLRSQISELQSEIDALQEELSSLQKKMDADIKDVKDDYGAKINALQEEINANQAKISELTTELANAKKELSERLETEITNLKTYIDGEVATINERIAKDEEELASAKEKHDQDIASLQADYSTKIETLTNTVNSNKESLENDYNAKLDALDADVAAKKKDIEDDYNAKISSLSEDMAEERKAVEDDYNSKITALSNDTDVKKKALEDDYNAKISSLNKDLENQKKALEDDYNAKLETLNSTYDAKCKALEDDIASCNSSLSEFKSQYESDKKNFEDVYNAKLEAVQTSYDAKISEIENDIASSKAEISSLKDEMNALIEEIQSDYNKKIDELSKRVSDLEGSKKHNVYFYLDNSNIQTLEVNDGAKITAPLSSLTKGYKISYWYNYDSGMKTPWNFSGCTVTSDLYLYAEYTYQTYYVTFKDTKFNLSDRWDSVKYKGYYNFSNIYSKSGYTLTGFSDEEGNDFPSSGTYTLTESVTLTAKWSLNEYSISYDLDGGVNVEGNPEAYSVESDEITLLTPTKEGYRFDGWSDGEKIVSSIPSGSVGNITLTATWSEYHSLSVTSSDETKGNVELLTSGDKFCEGDSITVKGTALDGFKFESWNINDNVVSTDEEYTFTMPNNDVEIIAKWESPKDFVVTSDDESLGSVAITSGDASSFTGDRITVEATPTSGCEFKGWYNEGKLVSSSNPYSFEMPSTNYSLVAKFYTAEEVLARKKSLGIIPEIDSEAKTLTYGLYPQNHVNDEATIASLNALTTKESNGWYLLDGKYYAKKAVEHYYFQSDGLCWSDGALILNSFTEWFKCEPITWNILEANDETYSLVSSTLLNAKNYYSSDTMRIIDGELIYPNNYEHSDMRSWLNNEFYDSAFALDDSLIQTVTVDNSVATTNYSTNQYACDNTEDKVYLLSYQDYENADYFADETARQCKVTDWAKANYAYYNTYDTDDLENGEYWTRSPYSNGSNKLWNIGTSGILSDDNSGFWFDNKYCVRPAITIKVA